MANEIQKPTTGLLNKLAAKYGLEPMKFFQCLRDTYFKADPPMTNEEMAAACAVCEKYDLDPFLREMHATRAKGRLLVMVGIDGWIRVAKRSGQFDGMEFEEVVGDDQKLHGVTCKVYRKDESHPTVVTAYMGEYKRDTEPWKQFPSRMLRHKAAKEALRYAFGISGIDDEEPDEVPVATQTHFETRRIIPAASSVVVDPMATQAPEPETAPPTREPGIEG